MENIDYQTAEDFNQMGKRPTGLIVLCVLTFIGSGMAFLSNFVSYALNEKLIEFMEMAVANMNGQFEEIYRQSIDIFANTPKYTFLFSAVLCVFSISGAAIMFAMRKIGFHVYTIAQILLVFMPQLLNKTHFNLLGSFVSMLFIALYFMYYKKME